MSGNSHDDHITSVFPQQRTLRRHHGSLILTFAGYNAGRGRGDTALCSIAASAAGRSIVAAPKSLAPMRRSIRAT
jgi:hypothetical protein